MANGPTPIVQRPTAAHRSFHSLLGLCALFSGAALVTHILTGLSLPLVLGTAGVTMALAAAAIYHRSPPAIQHQIVLLGWVGLGSGVLATVAYDVAKVTLSRWDPSPYDPFEALPVFGALLVGPTAPRSWTMVAGGSFHVLNGLSFAVAYAFLFGRGGIVSGVLWGVFLETFQLTLFPGWLDIRAYREFAQISFVSHLIYGAVLGWACARGISLTRSREVQA